MSDEILNMKVEEYSLEISEFGRIHLLITLEGQGSGVIMDVPLEKIIQIFKLFEITDLKQLKSCYCRAVFSCRMLKRVINIIKDEKIYENKG